MKTTNKGETVTYPAYQMIEKGPAHRVELTDADLPESGVTIDVTYSSLNFKDGLAMTGKGGRIARTLPMVCGIDLTGTVVESDSTDFTPGDQVVATGGGLSEVYPGGYTTRQRVPADILVKRPETISPIQSMAIGTAGFTAMLAVLALEKAGVTPDKGPILVTGSGGGVGSVAIAILAKLGYQVEASTGREETHDYLRGLGATSIVDRNTLTEPGKPLGSERWAGAVDNVGSTTLANVLSQIKRHGSVASCGLAAGHDLLATVMPFILRGVNLLGIDSVGCPMDLRRTAWERLATDLPSEALDTIHEVRPFDELPSLAEDILAGRTRGRIVIELP